MKHPPEALKLQYFPQALAGVGTGDLGNLFGSSLGDQSAARRTAFRSKVDDPIGRLHQLQVVFHHHHGVACIHQALEHPQQTGGIGQVQAGGGFVEQIQRATR